MHYNIYVGQGCDKNPALDKLDKLAGWLKEQDADILALCECNGWQGWNEDIFEDKLGYPYSMFQDAFRVTRAHVMFLSKYPIELIPHRELHDTFFHALLHVKVNHRGEE